MRLGLSTYSFWHFRGEPYPVLKIINMASKWDIGGIEILERQLTSKSLESLREIRREAYLHGVNIYALASHQDFVSPDPKERAKQVEITINSLKVAEILGANCVRINSGRWKTIKNFDDLMKANGYEPPLEGYTDDDAFAWVIESIGKVLETAESMGIILGLENHWGLTRTAKGVLRILNAFSSPYIGAVLDVGNFKSQDMYEQMDMIAKYAVLVHAKSYLGGGEWYELDIDYYKVKEILRKHNYDGYISLEYEGKADPHVAVPQELDRLKRILLV